MNRRQFLQLGTLATMCALSPTVSAALGREDRPRLLVMVELKGGNDGLNTVIPYTDPAYYAARPKIAVPREDVLPLEGGMGFNPALAALMPLWQAGHLALVQGVGYPEPNLSHFRSIEIWDTASDSRSTLTQGWLTRQFAARPLPADYAVDGVTVGTQELGPFEGGARAVVLQSPDAFVRQARLAADMGAGQGNGALAHLMKVESDIRAAAKGLASGGTVHTTFPDHGFGRTVRTAMQALAANPNIGALRLSLSGFDTHINQRGQQDRLLRELAEGLMAMRTALTELGRWDDSFITTYAEFGRRVGENRSNGTDHGTANVHFVLGGGIRGGLYGPKPDLQALDAGNLRFGVDFRQLYATACRFCWQDDGALTLGGRFKPLDLLRA